MNRLFVLSEVGELGQILSCCECHEHGGQFRESAQQVVGGGHLSKTAT